MSRTTLSSSVATVLVNAYATHASPSPIPFPHQLRGWRDRSDPELLPHLAGMSGFVTKLAGATMTTVVSDVLSHISRVRNHWSFEVDPEQSHALAAWGLAVNAIFFLPNSSIRDPNGLALLEAGTGAADPAAAVPFLPDAQQRKETVTAALQARGYATSVSLPPIASTFEVVLPTVGAAMDRLSAITAIAVQGESVNSGQPMQLAQFAPQLPRAARSLSPIEQAFFDHPSQADPVQFAWRYECLPVLLWALGLQDQLDLPTSLVDAAVVTSSVVNANLDAIEATTTLRPPSQILDHADLTFRLHWAIRNAQYGDTEMPPGIDPGVVLERRRAFEWLMDSRTGWDNVNLST